MTEATLLNRLKRFGYGQHHGPMAKACAEAHVEIERLTTALERIALLDEADGHLLKEDHAFRAVAIATSTLGKHPSEIYAERISA